MDYVELILYLKFGKFEKIILEHKKVGLIFCYLSILVYKNGLRVKLCVIETDDLEYL